MKKKLFAGFAVGLMMLGMGRVASAQVIDFDDLILPPYGSIDLDGTAYKGFIWGGLNSWGPDVPNWLVSSTDDSVFSSFFGWSGDFAHSDNNFAWSNSGADLYLSKDSLFDLASMWIRAGGDDSVSLELTVIGSKQNLQMYTQTFSLNSHYQLISPNLIGIDKIILSTNFNGNLLIDDITVNGSNPVPEPATMLLFGTGLAGLAAARRRKKAC